MKKKADDSVKFTLVPEQTLIKQRQEALAIIHPLKGRLLQLEVTDTKSYADADSLLYDINQGITKREERINELIKPFKAGLDGMYAFRREITQPLEDMKAQLKERMRAFKILEARQIQEEQDAKRKQEEELQKALDAKEKAEAKAKTPGMLNRIQESKAALQQALATSRATTQPAPVRGLNSQAKKVKKWRVVDTSKLVSHILGNPTMKAGDIQMDLISLITIDSGQMDAYFKLHDQPLGEFLPGMEGYEDIQIAGKR